MNDERLLELIAAYGAAPMAWPEAEREAALAHLDAHPARFEAALADARALDHAFSTEVLPDAPAELAGKIMASAPWPDTRAARRPGPGLAGRMKELVFPNGLRWPAGATVAALVMGLFAGVATAPATAENGYSTDGEQVVYSALGYDNFAAYIEEVDG
ncbi:hypothetical protein [Henriciella sp.]|uniref:hypothetical protein n=1 Tax=Henriciella sp. TaxID=1968823 RepID=UPI00262B86F3|nr:hypothetical protein [Henriciella sp.]